MILHVAYPGQGGGRCGRRVVGVVGEGGKGDDVVAMTRQERRVWRWVSWWVRAR